MDDEKLLEMSHLGLIPFDGETQEAFEKRVHYCLKIKTHLEQHLNKEIPSQPEVLEETLPEADRLYGIRPAWVPILFSNEKLLPWQGGVAWIFQLEATSPLSAMIQLREKVYAFFGSRKERIVHEMAHIGRMGFEEKKFEEMLAYQSSKSHFRRLIGPLFQSSGESVSFASLLALLIVFDLLLIFSGSLYWYDRFVGLKIVPLLFLAFLLIRLYFRQKVFQRVLSKFPLSLIYRLTDEEIERFSKDSPEDIQVYLEKGKDLSLRRRLIYLLSKNISGG